MQSHLGATERLFAFLDEVYVVCSLFEFGTFTRTFDPNSGPMPKIQMHKGKNHVWNRGGVAPDGWERLNAEAQRSDPDAVVWREEHHASRHLNRSHGPWHSSGSLGLRPSIGACWEKIQHIGRSSIRLVVAVVLRRVASEPHPSYRAPACLTLVCSSPWRLSEDVSQCPVGSRSPRRYVGYRIIASVCCRHWPPRSCQKQAGSLLVELGGLTGDSTATRACLCPDSLHLAPWRGSRQREARSPRWWDTMLPGATGGSTMLPQESQTT